MRYVVLIEKIRMGYGAYVPDLPGCVAAGDSIQSAELLIRLAIEMHLDKMRRDGKPIPEPAAVALYVEAGSEVSPKPSDEASTNSATP
jgi:predicted RNase H-like HicB family nuclease